MQFRIDFRVTNHGWADVEIADGLSVAAFKASYLHDSLLELANAAIALLAGAQECSAVFMDEPGEHHVVFRRFSGIGASFVEIRRFDDWASWGIHQKDEFSVVSKYFMDSRAFAEAVEATLSREHERLGEIEYRRRWVENDFPTRKLSELREALAAAQ